MGLSTTPSTIGGFGIYIMTLFDDETSRRANRKQQFDDNFTRAMQKAFMEDLKGFLKLKSRRLLPFEEVKEKLEIWFA